MNFRNDREQKREEKDAGQGVAAQQNHARIWILDYASYVIL